MGSANKGQSSLNFKTRKIKLDSGKTLTASPVFDTYWKFAAKRQDIFMKRVAGYAGQLTDDPILSTHRFTNAYRASDRVSQFLIKNVLYDGSQNAEEVFFRAMIFKIFNRIDTWELFKNNFSTISWKTFNYERYARLLDEAMDQNERLYSAAYIMPSPAFGSSRKHRNHLQLIEHMIRSGGPKNISRAKSLKDVYYLMLSYPSLGPFLAFQFTIDLNYSSLIDFDESDFVVAGPGAKNGISKCFVDTDGLDEEHVIYEVTKMADKEFSRQNLKFQNLWGRPLKPIDCQNLFCEVDKYARVAHPEFSGSSGRTRIKQKFSQNLQPLPQWYPPKWNLKVSDAKVNSKKSRSPLLEVNAI